MTEPSSVRPGRAEAAAVGPAVGPGAAGDAPAPASPPRGSSDSDDDAGPPPPRRPRPKRRCLRLGPDVPSVPVYSNKVNSCFRLCPTAQLRDLPAAPQPGEPPIDVDAEEEEEEEEEEGEGKPEAALEPEPSEGAGTPGSPCSPQPLSGRTRRIIRDVDRRLRGLSSLVLGCAGRGALPGGEAPPAPPAPPAPRLLQLKVQRRAELYRVPLRTSEPLQAAVEHMARVLRVPAGRILLLLRDRQLEPSATPQALGLGVADIVECVVDVGAGGEPEPGPGPEGGPEPEGGPAPGPGELRLAVQGQDRRSLLRLNVPKAAPLAGLMERYRAARGLGSRPLRFFFEGRRLAAACTPEELGLEQDDVIEVWA
ncbi:NFATC2-interacting protein isoform X2 [Struthio camelus]|uniref:NFATC2-interacting protein isoform X2 n=1 Tax=Struthio camelus TaxID=8801 RepID=UPI0036041BBF